MRRRRSTSNQDPDYVPPSNVEPNSKKAKYVGTVKPSELRAYAAKLESENYQLKKENKEKSTEIARLQSLLLVQEAMLKKSEGFNTSNIQRTLNELPPTVTDTPSGSMVPVVERKISMPTVSSSSSRERNVDNDASVGVGILRPSI